MIIMQDEAIIVKKKKKNKIKSHFLDCSIIFRFSQGFGLRFSDGGKELSSNTVKGA